MLSEIDMRNCSFTGLIPSTISTLTGLTYVDLSENFFTGSIPSFYMSKNLQLVDLSDNSLSGSIPKSLFGLPSLQILRLSNNQLSGRVYEFSTLHFPHIKPYHFPSSLFYLDLHSNLLQGELPPLPQYAEIIDYSNNKFEKSIPLSIGDSITNLGYLSLANNSLSEAIPTSFCNATQLEVLDLSSNKLSGSIPPCLVEKVEQLAVLKLGGNNINGHIPDTFSVNCSLEILDMSQNYLEGRLPVSLANCKSLQILDVGNNNIDDGFPCMLPSSLRVLVLRSNKFHGQVRCSRRWTNLQIIDIASNNFTGYLYTKSFSGLMLEKDARLESDYIHFNTRFAYAGGYYQGTVKVIVKGVELELVKILTIFTAIDFSCNNFQGEIPDAI
ncbi:UNVERIFIED_CONTAM: Receptor-like protein 18, partial [Sesamum indicum]